MDDNITPLIGAQKKLQVTLEFPATYTTTLFFINHQGEFTTTEFALPPGVYPNPEWLKKLLEGVYRSSLKALKTSTKDLSWRKPTPMEFVRATAGGQPVQAALKWAEPYSSKLEIADELEPEIVSENIDKS